MGGRFLVKVGDLVKRKHPSDLAGRVGIIVSIQHDSERFDPLRTVIEVFSKGRAFFYWTGDWEVVCERR